MDTDMNDIIIIGAGLAGLTVAETLHAEGHAGTITVLGDEPYPPYHRPPLSKGYLLGQTTEAQVMMRAPEMLTKKNITLKVGAGVTAIDRSTQKVFLADGSTLAYDGLALCTGSRLRPLPLAGAEWQGVHGLRSLDDAKAIATALETVQNMVVIGGGFIGLEIAAAARKQGKQVTVLEAADRLMARVVSPLISQFYLDLHRGHGVDIVLGAKVTELVGNMAGNRGHIAAVRTADDREFPAELLIVGIGVIANAELAQAAGLDINGGIVVDACSRTADPMIVAAGDCTIRRLENGQLLRLESVQNATEQAKSAAFALLGKERPFTAAPWFWSDQYDIKLQMIGLTAGFDQVVLRGKPEERKFSAFYYHDGRLLAIDSINRPADHMAGRKLFEQGVSPTPEQAADTTFALNTLLG
jgi:3-phenylpropionate/trans-cinnamate dioxygenase ferredoxin reductase subunit